MDKLYWSSGCQKTAYNVSQMFALWKYMKTVVPYSVVNFKTEIVDRGSNILDDVRMLWGGKTSMYVVKHTRMLPCF